MPDIEKLRKALEDRPPADRTSRSDDPLRLNPEVMRFQVEKNLAPIVTRDATMGILSEMRRTTRWAKGAFFAAIVVPVALFAAGRLL